MLSATAHVVVGFSVFAAFVFATAVLFQRGWNAGLLCLMAAACLFIASVPLFVGAPKKLFEPIWSVVLVVSVGITGKAFYLLYGPTTRTDFLLLGRQPKDLLFPILVIAGGLVCLVLGYLLGTFRWRLPRAALRLEGHWNQRKFVAVVGILAVLGCLSFLLFTRELEVSYQSLSDISSKRFVEVEGSSFRGTHGYLRWGAMLLEISFYLALAYWIARKRRFFSVSGFFVAALGAMAVLFPIFVSSRQSVLFLVIRAVLIWLCLRGEPKARTVIVLVIAGLFVISSMLAFRRGLSEWQDVRDHAGLDSVLEVTVGGRHFLDLSKTAQVILAVPERVAYQYGRTMVTWITAPIPRSIWPGKPAVGAGIELGPKVFGTAPGTGVPPGIVGELYMNFGLIGVLMGLFVAGLLLRSMFQTLAPRLSNPNFVVLYAVLTPRMAMGALANSVSGSVVKLLQEMVPLFIALYLCTNRRIEDE